ncbi:hypothetical protein CXB51_035046 [Gossypium anomalum]|uniref:Sister chromatid cohesion 1 protein 4-like n=1 Tax=Gossypium anomalum TaxID=47600 RepID=A0A8J6CHR2_9ROSI|nr:hypothetical protein CXB51_035046 [Gossypium anomalum]
MFYSQFILAKKGPLGTIWIAAHLERKLRKNQVADTDIGVSVDSILFPEVPIALRLSSHLLLGVVRIYSRKVNYLFDDCSEALLKIKQAFRSTAVDLPPEESTAPYHSITLPETFDLDDFELPDNEIFQGNYVDNHISSREQITLQDTMGNVVYSTSQFGLDERFGEGDTSQIGLLDEELVLDRVAVPGSVEVSEYDLQGSDVPQKASNLEAVPMVCGGDQDEDLATNSEFVENDQYVATPGLMELPNLSGDHKVLADHMESEHYNLTELGNECVENASKKSNSLDGDTGPVDQSLDNDVDHDAVPPKNGCHFGDMEKEQTKPPGNSVHDALSVEYTSAVGTVRGPDGLDRVEDMQNGVMHSIDRTDGECAESPSCSNITCDLEGPSRRTCLSSICVPTSDGCLENGQASHKSENGNDAETTDILEEPFSPAKAIASNPSSPLELPSRPTVIDGEAQASLEPNDSENPETPIVHENLSSVQVLGSDSLAAAEQNLVDLSRREEEVHARGASIEVQVEACQTQSLEPALCDDQLENSNNCAMSDLPAPEKLLSAPEGLLDKPSDLLGESTPDKEVLAENDDIDTGTKLISGKKRSIAESTLTIENMNSVESFGRPRSMRTAESVPDDDDLLSSILVGRRSSVFKMKPTPPLEVASMKRARSAPRSSTIKRKVLVDDTMVLHGDTIREQLVNTEDIRRIRKKAPCTRPEISLIQRKFLEDEIFSEPIFTGISGDLACLHGKPYDRSSVRISEGEEFHASSELAKNLECSVRPSIGEAGIEGSSVPVIHGSDEQTQSAAIPNETDTQQGEYSDPNAQQDRFAVDVPQFLQHEPLDGITEMEIDKDNVEVATLANCSVLNELGVSSHADLDTGGTSNKAEEVTNAIDGSMLNIATCLPPDQKMTTQPGEDASELDLRNDKGTNTTEVLEHNVESIIAAETESKAADELLEESKANTSVEVSVVDCPEPIENGYDSLAAVHSGEFVNGAQNAYETGYGKIDVADEAQVEGSFLDNEHKDSIFKGSEESKLDSTYSEKVDMALKNASLIDGETPIFLEVDAVNEEMISLADNRTDYEDVAVANDTEFLNVDDNELGGDEDDDGMPCGDESRLLENSGWSSRTRAVAKYLQNLFEGEVIHGHKVLSMDSLLARKTQKEASRMFFETLVLKTRDYIHVEQGKPFDNIYIMPRAKLMKSDF